MDWLRFVTEGGTLVAFVIVLFWVFRASSDRERRLLDMITSQTEYIRTNTQILERLCASVDHHEERSQERHGTREEQAQGRHREVMTRATGSE